MRSACPQANASDEQRAGFEAGEGGKLAPLMWLDNDLQTLAGFDALVAETERPG